MIQHSRVAICIFTWNRVFVNLPSCSLDTRVSISRAASGLTPRQATQSGWGSFSGSPSRSILGSCCEILCRGFKGERENRLSFKFDFFLFFINLSDCPFWMTAPRKNLLKALDLRWLEIFLLKFWQDKKQGEVVWLSHRPINPLDLNLQYIWSHRPRPLPSVHKGLSSKLYLSSWAWKWILRRIVFKAPGTNVVQKIK